MIMECRNSGLSDYQWCKHHDIKSSTFYGWIKQVKKHNFVIPEPADSLTYTADTKPDIIFLDVHEIENLIPLNVLDYIIEKLNISSQGINFMKFLIDQDNSKTSPVFYFDLKKGIPETAFFLEENANEESIKKYQKLKDYREYWKPYIENFGIKIEKANGSIIFGICDKILGHSLDYFDTLVKEGSLGNVVEPYLTDIWLCIGEKIYCWGCVGGRIAV